MEMQSVSSEELVKRALPLYRDVVALELNVLTIEGAGKYLAIIEELKKRGHIAMLEAALKRERPRKYQGTLHAKGTVVKGPPEEVK